MSIATNAAAEGVAAPLDLLLVNSTKPFGRRLVPGGPMLRFGLSLAQQPIRVAERGASFATELGEILAGRSPRQPARGDKRFIDPAWTNNPLLRRVKQTYLAVSAVTDDLLADAQLDWRDAEKVRFALDNLIQGSSPTNSPVLNPLGWKALIDTGGASAVRGLRAFVRDMAQTPRVPAMVEPDAYEVGQTVAATKGAVVLRTDVFELIEYAPCTPSIRLVPLLIVPPVINKFYIMDMAPKRSLVEHYVRGGQRVFVMSWRNPHARHRNWGFDKYGSAIVEALQATRAITGSDRSTVFGTCSGGILAAMTLAHLFACGHGDRIAAFTMGVTVLDQSNAGFASALPTERSAKAAIRTSARKGYLDGRLMAEMFAWLRPTDLVWRYWVNNYIEGRKPDPFDVLFWNADTVRMTAALHRDMVMMALNNDLATPGAATMLGTPVDLGTITADAYTVGGIADHICPWQATYRSAALLGSKDNRYVLSSSGHIASLVNPPGNPKASFRAAHIAAEAPADLWLSTNHEASGSWWPDHLDWLTARGGSEIDAPTALGAAGYEPLGPAPGTYVLES